MANISFLDNLTIKLKEVPSYDDFLHSFKEPLDKEICNIIMASNNPAYTQQMKSHFQKIITCLDKNNNLNTKWYRNHNLGRFYADGDISMTPHSRVIKHTLYSYLEWLDVDMVKGHQSIAYEMSQWRKKPLINIRNVLDDFDAYAAEIIQHHQKRGREPLNPDDVKQLNNLTIYGGSLSTWVADLKKEVDEEDGNCNKKPKIVKNELSEHPKYLLFKQDIQSFNEAIIRNNKDMITLLKKKGDTLYQTHNRVISYWYQTIENHILYITYQFMVNEGIIQPYTCALEYDGLCIPKPSIDFDTDDIIHRLNETIEKETGLSIK